MKHIRIRQRVGAVALILLLCVSLPFAAADDTRAEPEPTIQFFTTVAAMETPGPNTLITRAHYIQILYQAAGAPQVKGTASYTDVPEDASYAIALVWAERHGIAKNDGLGVFRPDDLITETEQADFFAAALAAVGETAQDLAAGVLAAYTGRIKTAEDWAISPRDLLSVLERMEQAESAMLIAPAYTNAGAPPVLCRT